MANKKTEDIVIKVPKGVKTVKIEFSDTPANENVSKVGRKKICD